ncbi:hypothetical protein F5Y16DRAFT_159521 [Xylariaceae sp. FL0255]|nr:hypothetical protein F5Y16DRAFT_159521 [Xylariaceae sp. FL0255]
MRSSMRAESRQRIAEFKAIKWRQWLILPTLIITAAALVIITIEIASTFNSFSSDPDDSDFKGFSFYDIPESSFRSKVVTAFSLQIALLVDLWAAAIHFLVFFHRDDAVYRRCTIQGSLSAALLALAVALRIVLENVKNELPLDFNPTTTGLPNLDPGQFSAACKSWLDDVLDNSVVLPVSVFVAAAHDIVLVFWLWLLPVRLRLPNRYEPVVAHKKNRYLPPCPGQGRGGSSREVVGVADSSTGGLLEDVFQKHEAKRLATSNGQKTSAKAFRSRLPKASNVSGGPKFEPIVRYWMLSPLHGSGAWPIGAFLMAFLALDLVLEIIFYSLTRAYGLHCVWYCQLAFAYPWPIVLEAVIIVVLLRKKVLFERRLFPGGPRLEVIFTITAIPLLLLWALVHITRFVDLTADGNNDAYQDYISSDAGRSAAYSFIFVLKIIEVSIAIFLGIAMSLLSRTMYKFYQKGMTAK